jgi:hypothetical protein
MKTQQKMNTPILYEIRVVGHLNKKWAERFEGLSMQYELQGETLLSGLLDQAALHGVFVKIRDLGLSLVEVKQIEKPVETDLGEPGVT